MPEELIREPGQSGEGLKEGGLLSPSIESLPSVNLEKESVVEAKEERYNELLGQLSTNAKAVPGLSEKEVSDDTKEVSLLTDEESRIQHLLDLAHTKGTLHAVRVARSLQDYYALDRMHDELSETFFKKLTEKGLLS
ncbi:MAG: hypothetical protein AAB615_00740 [Patescibacteria group bacterium]